MALGCGDFFVKYIETSQKILYNTIITITVLQISNNLKKGGNMKNLFKRIIASITAATLAAGSVPLNMTASAQLAPVKVNGCCLPRKTQKVGNHGISRN